MTASELIARVELLMQQYGDLRVLNSDDGSIVDTASVEVLSRSGAESVILISGSPPPESVLHLV